MSSEFQTVFDFILQLTDQSLNLIQKFRPLIHQLRTNEQLQQILQLVTELSHRLPESVSLSLTVFLIFMTSLFLFRVGKSLISLIVTLIQISIVLVVVLVVWKLRDPLRVWIEGVLNE